MSIIEILMYSIGTVFLLATLMFARYTIGSARLMPGPLGHKLMAFGAIGFIIFAIVEVVNIFLFPGAGLAYISAVIWAAGVSLIVAGGFLWGKMIKEVHEISMFDVLFTYAEYYLVGIITLVFIGTPVYLLDLLQPLAREFSWLSVGSVSVWAFAFVSLAIGERKFYFATRLPVAAREELMLRDEIRALGAYLSLTNGLLARVAPAIGISGVKDLLARCVENHPALLEGQEPAKNGMLNSGVLRKNFDQIREAEKVRELSTTFSDLNTRLIDLYAAVTSPERAREVYDKTIAYSAQVYGGIVQKNELPMLLFGDVLEPLLLECKGKTLRAMRGKIEKLGRDDPVVGALKITDDGSVTLGEVYRRTALYPSEERAKRVISAFSSVMGACYPLIQQRLGARRANELISKAASGLLERHGQFLHEVGLDADVAKAMPSGVLEKEKLTLLSREELEQKVKEKIAELERAYKEVTKADQMKSEFLDIVSHELREPLTGAKLYIDMLKAGEFGKLARAQKERLEKASKNIERVAEMVGDMLDLSRIEARRAMLTAEPISIRELVEKIIAELKPELRQKRHVLAVKISRGLPLIEGDKPLLDKVIRNLLTNAIHYTPSRGKITVSAIEEGENIHLKVSDTGIGISKKDQERIFEKFYLIERVPGAGVKGLVIGLATVKGIVEMHHGQVWVESEVGKGSTFHVMLPKKLSLEE